MKWIQLLLSIALFTSTTIMAPAYAQESPDLTPANNVSIQRPRHFNPTTVETLSGKVVKVDRVARPGRRGGKGVHLSLQTSEETVDVHLGPSWYLNEQPFSLKSGDQVEVTGPRVTDASSPTIIATQVKSGDTVLNLRDENGLPAWRGMGRDRGMGRNRGDGRGPWRDAQ